MAKDAREKYRVMESIAERVSTRPDEARGSLRVQPRHLLLISDLVSICLAALLMYAVFKLRDIRSEQATITAVMAALTMVTALGLSVRAGQYTNRRRISPLSDVGSLARDLVVATAAATLLSYLTKGFFTGFTTPSRLAVVSFIVTFFALGIASRVGLNAYQRHLFAQGRAVRKVLLLGTGVAAKDFLDFVANRPWLGVAVTGQVTYGEEDDSPGKDRPARIPASAILPIVHLTSSLTGLQRLDEILRASKATEVVVALDQEEHAFVPQVANLLSLAHVPFKVVPSLFEQSYRATELLGFAEIPVIDVEVDALDRVARLFKRAMDVCVAVTALVLLLPLLLLVILVVVVDSGLPVIYKQVRVGKNARHFCMYKFRTMVRDADARKRDLESLNQAGADGRMFKMRQDPRVTRVGLILRRYSLDELPQLVNVLKNDMSMVGPRPPLPEEVEKYEQEHIYRLRALPGITGLWQVSGRSHLGFDDMVKLDRYYLDNWSISQDFGILLKTLFVVVTRKGAY